MMTQEMEQYVKDTHEELLQLIRDIAPIPAPSRQEDARVEWVVNYLKSHGAEGVYVDEQKNVIWPYNVTEDNDLVVIMGHTDVVFPDLTPLPFREDEEFFYCPGISDDTARLAAVLMAGRFFVEREKKTKEGRGILFIANACEEGLGNSMGAYTVLKNYGKRIKFFVSNDSRYYQAVNRAVGSHRYEINVKTVGGHSWRNFGNRNAIFELADLLRDLYTIQVPVKENCKTTYNVGTISGGTSVNTIAQDAKCLYEYRSDDAECLAYMQAEMEKKIAAHRNDEVEIGVELLGARPCNGDLDKVHQAELEGYAIEALKETNPEYEMKFGSASTDANFPLSMGIPALTVGSCSGDGVHTRQERLYLNSIVPGMRFFMDFVGHFFEV